MASLNQPSRIKSLLLACAASLLMVVTVAAEPIREEFDVGEDAAGVKDLLKVLAPEVTLEVDSGKLILISGSREAMEQALELLRQLDRPLDRVSVRAQMVGLSSVGQAELGIRWQRGAIGNAAGLSFMNHYFGQSNLPLQNVVRGSLPDQEAVTESGTDAAFSWSDPMVFHSFESGKLVKQNAPQGVDLQVTSNVKPDGFVVCKLFLVSHVQGKRYETGSDIRLRSGQSVAIRNFFGTDQIPPAFAFLPTLGSLFQAPFEPVLIVTPTILESAN